MAFCSCRPRWGDNADGSLDYTRQPSPVPDWTRRLDRCPAGSVQQPATGLAGRLNTAAAAAASPTAVPQIVVPTLATAPSPAAAASPSPGRLAGRLAHRQRHHRPPLRLRPPQLLRRAAVAPKPSGTVKRGGTLKINSQNDRSTMDVQTSQTGNPDSPLVFDFLARIDHNLQTGAFEVKPHLAESWDTSGSEERAAETARGREVSRWL